MDRHGKDTHRDDNRRHPVTGGQEEEKMDKEERKQSHRWTGVESQAGGREPLEDTHTRGWIRRSHTKARQQTAGTERDGCPGRTQVDRRDARADGDALG